MHTSTNPFEDSNTRTLKDAFPALDGELIEDVLRSVNGNMEEAFDNLLRMSDPESTTRSPNHSSPPPIPQRRGRQCNSRTTAPRRTSSDHTNPFLNGCRSDTRVRQDLAEWRRQLAEESRQRRQCSRNSWRTSARSSTPAQQAPSFSSTIPQDWRNYGTASLTDLVETGRQSRIMGFGVCG
ncbi:hypothetical protein BJV82DRAFT_309111 [Fennellomyces sp. T-0311]|nr:hypothetical protein BJV82DRAFT_309111 [Fennellomyces sp. T-0311]